MSKYTTQLRWIVEQIGQGLPVPEGQRYANAVYKYIGLDKYPIFNDAYRAGLNDKIIDHFFFREIGFETAGQFAFYLRRTMNEIMPKYNALYEAQLTMDLEHPLSDYILHKDEEWNAHVDDDTQKTSNTLENENFNKSKSEDMSQKSDETTNTSSDNTTTSQSTDHNRNVYQDTPMSLLSNDGSPSIEGLDYATNVTYDDGNGTTNGTSETDTSTRDIAETNKKTTTTDNELKDKSVNVDSTTNRDKDDKGNRVIDEYGIHHSWAELMNEFAEKWVNIDMLVIADLEDLFMGVW